MSNKNPLIKLLLENDYRLLFHDSNGNTVKRSIIDSNNNVLASQSLEVTGDIIDYFDDVSPEDLKLVEIYYNAQNNQH